MPGTFNEAPWQRLSTVVSKTHTFGRCPTARSRGKTNLRSNVSLFSCFQYQNASARSCIVQRLSSLKQRCFSEDSLCTMHDLADAFWYWKHENNDTLLRKFV